MSRAWPLLLLCGTYRSFALTGIGGIRDDAQAESGVTTDHPPVAGEVGPPIWLGGGLPHTVISQRALGTV